MKRFVACGLAFLAGLAAGRAEATPRVVSVVFNGGPDSPQQIGAEAFRQAIRAHFGDKLAVDLRGGSTLGSENSLILAVQNGAADFAVLTGPAVGPVVPNFGIFDVPFLFRDTAHVQHVVDGPIGTSIASNFPAKGLVLLAVGEQGFRNITNSKRPIQTASDVKGLKMRVVPNEIYQMTFRTLGADAVPLDLPLLYAALKDNRVDGEENPVATVAVSHFQDVQKYMSLTGHFYSALAFIENLETSQKFSPADAAAIAAAAREAAETTRTASAAARQKYLDELKKSGMQIVESVDRDSFVAALAPLEPQFEERFGKDKLAAIRATP
ncbi:MAG TPA: TRAP transporter substrate-binding protein [Aliidongia sp.]|nr:TRAP transporter substrate-binding protein [Aliidongia sp.]